VAEFGLRFCFVFLLIAGLSFLGLGIQPPTADWGSMVRDNATLISFGEITPLIPAAAIALLDRGGQLRGRLDAVPVLRSEGATIMSDKKDDPRHQGPQDRGRVEDKWFEIVHGVDLTLHKGEVLGLIGESGAGKSTIGLAAMGFTRDGCRISDGTIDFDGMDLTTSTQEECARCAARASPMSRSRRRRPSTRRTS
jgi:ABC-type transport system involved in cytochrome bd biosynthesis fused ATPase/permease subunit